jgi:hypothetical protein
MENISMLDNNAPAIVPAKPKELPVKPKEAPTKPIPNPFKIPVPIIKPDLPPPPKA